MFETRVPLQLDSGEDCFPCLLMATLLLHPRKVKRGSSFSSSSRKGTNPATEDPFYYLTYN